MLLDQAGVISYQRDLSDLDALERDIAQQSDVFANLGGFIHLAADLRATPFAEATPNVLMNALATNVVSALTIARHVAPPMTGRGYGRIVFSSSIGVAFGGGEMTLPYSLSKHALEFIPAISRDWAAANVLFNVVRVGVTNTRIHMQTPGKYMDARVAKIPMGRMAEPDEVARLFADLATPRNTYIAGQVIGITGGE